MAARLSLSLRRLPHSSGDEGGLGGPRDPWSGRLRRVDLFFGHRPQPDRPGRVSSTANGSGFERLSSVSGTHRPFSIRRGLCISTSGATSPRRRRCGSMRPAARRQAAPCESSTPTRQPQRDYRLSKPELLEVTTRDGVTMQAMMIKPPDFPPRANTPSTSPSMPVPTRRTFRTGGRYRDYSYFPSPGAAASSSGSVTTVLRAERGHGSVWPLAGAFGALELRDIEDGVAWLKRQPYVNGSRIGIARRQLWGVHHPLCAHTRPHFVMGICQGSRHRLAALRHDLHRALHGPAGGERGRLPPRPP